MNRIYGFVAGILIGLCWFGVAVSLILVSGCTIYDVKVTKPDGTLVEWSSRSNRQIEQPNLHYARDADAVEFDFSATSMTPVASPIEEAVASGIASGAIRFVGSPVKGREDDQ